MGDHGKYTACRQPVPMLRRQGYISLVGIKLACFRYRIASRDATA